MQQSVRLCSLWVYQQNNLWVVMFLAYFYTLISSWQDVWIRTQLNKLQLVQLWYSGMAGNHAYMTSDMAQLPGTCSCWKAFPRLLLHSVVGPLPFHTSEVMAIFWQKPMFSLSMNVAWHPKRWLTWICSWYQGGHVYCTDSVLFFFLRPFMYILLFQGFTGPYAACLMSFFNLAYIVISF
jgi:hypothetical protein